MEMHDFLVEPYAYTKPAYKGIRQYCFVDFQSITFRVQFAKTKNNPYLYIMDFSIANDDNDEYDTINSTDVFKKMSTLIHILNEFIEDNPICEQVEFTPVSENDHQSNRRLTLFERYIKPFVALIHWNYSINNQKFTLTKIETKA